MAVVVVAVSFPLCIRASEVDDWVVHKKRKEKKRKEIIIKKKEVGAFVWVSNWGRE
jgi:hypothetical protein